jgi:TRAP-type C4-dicarboxylate transport system permease small subunit
MTALYVIWGILVVPAFAVFVYHSMQWAHEDLAEITNNDKLGIYSISGLLALGWPIIALMIGVKLVNDYINGPHD